MRSIFKYALPFAEIAKVTLPEGAEVVRVASMDGFCWMWAIVDTEAPTETRTFLLFKTGAPMPVDKKLRYHGFVTIYVQMELCLYVFEEIVS